MSDDMHEDRSYGRITMLILALSPLVAVVITIVILLIVNCF